MIQSTLEEFKADMDSVTRWVRENVAVGECPSDTGSAPDWVVKDASGVMCADVEEMFRTYAFRCEGLKEKPVGFNTFSKRVYSALELSQENGAVPGQLGQKRARIDGERRRVLYGVNWCAAAE